MRNNQNSRRQRPIRATWTGLGALTAWACTLLFTGSPALAETSGGWGDWWLPPDHSVHGAGMDSLFNWIFWITMVTFVAVEIVLVVFIVKYRYREGRRAIFTHGNTRLEMAWTIAPAIILALLALFSKKVWDNYRYSPTGEDPHRAIVLAIGEQFKWNFVYPGPDGKLGRYLMYPKPTDEKWQNPDGSDKPFMFQNVAGPAELGPEAAIRAINAYIAGENPLGKDFSDPDGKDDSWVKQAGTRELVIPKGRPIEVQLSSKDVIHDFFLPNFRVKLDAVPGMRGQIFFTATKTTREREASSRKIYKIDELVAASKRPENGELTLAVTKDTPQTDFYKPRRGTGYQRYADKDGNTIARDGAIVSPTMAEQLKTAGVTEVTAFLPGTWELVCAELCGASHFSMKGVVRIVDSDEYDAMNLDKPFRAPAPPVALGAAK
ncbi:hypothetical protein BH09PLA1_BH09PLA1_28860 [soil metagenome]